jgi:hypothetical protein
MDAPRVDDDLRQLGQLLWRYREQFEQLEFLLDVQRLLAAGGSDRWLGRVVDLLDVAAADLHALEGRRVQLLGQLGPQLGLGSRPTLGELVARSPEPWGDLLADHLRWFTREVANLAALLEETRTVVAHGLAGVQHLLEQLRGSGGGGYDGGGRPVAHATAGALLFDDRA